MIGPLFFICVIYQFKTLNLGECDKGKKATLNSQNVTVNKYIYIFFQALDIVFGILAFLKILKPSVWFPLPTL